jgi:hypothetical protein
MSTAKSRMSCRVEHKGSREYWKLDEKSDFIERIYT